MLLNKQVHFHIVQRALAMNNRLCSRICLPTSGETVALSVRMGRWIRYHALFSTLREDFSDRLLTVSTTAFSSVTHVSPSHWRSRLLRFGDLSFSCV